ncbi:peptidase [Brevibacillus fluminis]|uniref:Peptidase n=1 Tax=Brevibacillus fluminis TaxID=511487 RepID=A0A3M8CZX8_9BACL|nr:M14 family zinc carboxypeptidase [Brevibacillus fluminis]RNB81283.1 peptidase [Brevibacillus fluminis]
MNKHIQRLLDEIPNFSRFLTLDELDASTQALAAEYPDIVTLSTVGYSTDGHPIQMLRIGNGPHRALFVGCPHPNEPIGAMTVEYLSRKLCEEPTLLKELDYTFYFIKAIDVDGLRLNEGWLKGPYSLEEYIRWYYRPALVEQVEWTFPYEYKSFKFNTPMPETLAFMNAIDEAQPHFLNSLHNADKIGTFFYLSERLNEDLYQQLCTLVTDSGLPLMKGEPEAPYISLLTEGFYQMPVMSQVYDFYESKLPKGEDPANSLQSGATSFEYSHSRYGTYNLISEVTIFADARMGDRSPTQQLRRDAVMESEAVVKECCAYLQQQYQRVLPFIITESRLNNAVKDFLKGYDHQVDHDSTWTDNEPVLDRPATVAELLDIRLQYWGTVLCVASMFIRVIEGLPDNPELEQIHSETKAWLDKELKNYLSHWNWSMPPIRELCRVQLGSALLIMEHLQKA